MRGLTLHQPWATAVAFGLKTIETRSWGVAYRGELAIHAALEWNGKLRAQAEQFARDWPWAEPLVGLAPLPLGEVVALVRLADCFEMTEEWIADEVDRRSREHAFGRYEPGRWAWILEDKRRVTGAPAKGRQRLWIPTEDEVSGILRGVR